MRLRTASAQYERNVVFLTDAILSEVGVIANSEQKEGETSFMRSHESSGSKRGGNDISERAGRNIGHSIYPCGRDNCLRLSRNAGRSGSPTRNSSWLGHQSPLDFDDTLTDLLAGGADLARSVRLGLPELGIQPLNV